MLQAVPRKTVVKITHSEIEGLRVGHLGTLSDAEQILQAAAQRIRDVGPSYVLMSIEIDRHKYEARVPIVRQMEPLREVLKTLAPFDKWYKTPGLPYVRALGTADNVLVDIQNFEWAP